MPINAHPEYIAAEGEYLQAQTLEEQIEKLKKMISLCPSHKSAENLRAQLKTRLKKLLEKKERVKKSRGGKKSGIKKEEMQAVIIGKTNTGKSSLLKSLTNVKPEISIGEFTKFTTKFPIIGMMPFSNVKIQLIENPAIGSEFYDKGLTNTADTLLILITGIEQLKEIEPYLEKTNAKKIIIFNKSDLLDKDKKRKIEATLKSKYKNYESMIISTKTNENIEKLKEKIFHSFSKIRVFTKEPGKPKSEKPIILNQDSSIKDVAEKIFHGFSEKIKEARITGPSSKFSNQIVSLNHKLKDLDVVEFKTK